MRKPTKETKPTLHLPQPKISARFRVQFGSSTIAASESPQLTLPACDVADRGIVRLGSTGITSER
jgi:hypothetical protein